MSSAEVRRRIAAAVAVSALHACATEPPQPLDQKPLFQLDRAYSAVQKPDCLHLFARYCEANGYKSCPEQVPSDRVTGSSNGSQYESWENCKWQYDNYLAKRDAIGQALDRVFDRALAAVPECVRDARDIPPASIRAQGINPALPDVAARVIVWGGLLQWKGMQVDCVEQLCQYQREYLKQYTEQDHYCLKLQLQTVSNNGHDAEIRHP
jgi:hypothetical protein